VYVAADGYFAATERFLDACHRVDARDVKDDALDTVEFTPVFYAESTFACRTAMAVAYLKLY
jgi:hypothetical protein